MQPLPPHDYITSQCMTHLPFPHTNPPSWWAEQHEAVTKDKARRQLQWVERHQRTAGRWAMEAQTVLLPPQATFRDDGIAAFALLTEMANNQWRQQQQQQEQRHQGHDGVPTSKTNGVKTKTNDDSDVIVGSQKEEEEEMDDAEAKEDDEEKEERRVGSRVDCRCRWLMLQEELIGRVGEHIKLRGGIKMSCPATTEERRLTRLLRRRIMETAAIQ